MIFNEFCKIVEKCLLEIPQHYPNVVLHEYIVMPNHIHGIIVLYIFCKINTILNKKQTPFLKAKF
jgi:REP element-mobilizing transposase RayT